MFMKKAIWTIIIIVLLLLVVWAIASINGEGPDGNGEVETREVLFQRAQSAGLEVTEDSLLVDLDEENDSGISGVAVLTELENDRTRIAVWLDGAGETPRPIHVHAESCNNLGDIAYSLNEVDNGFSNSEVFATFSELSASAPFAINAHESADAMQNNIACGNIDFEQEDERGNRVFEGAGGGAADDDDTATTTDEDDDDEDADAGANATIRYTNSGFDPADLVVARGTTVTFVNESSGQMWVASNDHPTHSILPGFDQLVGVATGANYEFTFDQEGTWGFHNHLSANHTGRIVVQ
jgi:plastocyanin